MNRISKRNTSAPRIDTGSPTPVSHQLHTILLQEIRAGVYKPGARIPSERDLAERFRISRASVRESIAALLHQGALFRTVGRGTFVASPGQTSDRAERKSLQIGFWISENIFNFVKPGYNQTLTGVAEACRNAGHTLRFHSVDEQRESLGHLFPADAVALDGNIVLGGVNRAVFEHLQSLECPLVLVDMLFHNASANAVRMDYAAGARLAMRHLIDLGHTEIGFIGFAGSEKYEVYWQTLEASGLAYHPRYVQFLQASELVPGILAGYESMQRLIAGGKLPTAVLITNDYVAVGAVEALSIAGISIPEKISVVGFDDLAQSTIPLTTVRADLVELGRIAARLLFQQIDGHREAAGALVPLELMVRGSTAPPLRIAQTAST